MSLFALEFLTGNFSQKTSKWPTAASEVFFFLPLFLDMEFNSYRGGRRLAPDQRRVFTARVLEVGVLGPVEENGSQSWNSSGSQNDLKVLKWLSIPHFYSFRQLTDGNQQLPLLHKTHHSLRELTDLWRQIHLLRNLISIYLCRSSALSENELCTMSPFDSSWLPVAKSSYMYSVTGALLTVWAVAGMEVSLP